MLSNALLKKLRILILSFWFFSILPTSFSVTSDGQTLTLDGDYFLGASASSFIGAYSSIIINNSTGATRTATLDGAGHTVYFPYNMVSSTFQFTGDGVVLTVQNVTFQGYNPAAVSYASANAKIIFGDNTKLILDKDISILYTDKTLTCSGNVLLDGQNLTLTASGDSALSMQGAGKTLTIKNTILKPQGPDSICCLDATSKIVLSNSTLELGRDGLAVNNGNLDIDGKVLVRGVDISYTGTQSLALLSKRIQNLGFVPWSSSYAKSGIYSLNLADVYSGNTTFTMVRVSKENKAYYSTSTDPYSVAWTEIVPSAVYKSIDVGDDGQIWVVKTDRTAHRVTRGAPPTLLAATNVSADYVVVGGSTYVFALNSVTGIVYQCNNPTNALDSWTAVTGIYFPRSIAAGNDGTLWFVSVDGRVYKKPYQSTKIEQVFDGVDRDIVKISVSGGQDSNCVVLLSSMPKDGRVLVSQSGGPFRDLGINKVVDAGIGINGSLTMAFDNSAIAENVTFGGQIYSKINSCAAQILTMDRSLTFSSDKYLTIKSGSELELSNYSTLRYQPSPGFDGIYLQRRHLVFQDYSSFLRLNRSNLDIGQNGLSLTTGNLIVNGLNWIYSSTQLNSELEFSSDFNVLVGANSNLNVIGPTIYAKQNLLYPGYFMIYGPSEATVKSGVVDNVVLQAVTDAYAQGFRAPGSAASEWQVGNVSIVDTSPDYPYLPTLGVGLGTHYSFGYQAYREILGSSLPYSFAGIDGVAEDTIDLSVDGYRAESHTDGSSYFHNVKIWNDSGPTYVFLSSNVKVVSVVTNNIVYFVKNDFTVNKYSSGVITRVGTFQANFTATTVEGTKYFHSISAGSDLTLWYVDKTSGNLIKREANNSESTITLPSGFSGSICSISAKGTTSSNYLAIASSTGQAFIKKDNGVWTNLGLSGVIRIAVGVRGTVVVMIKKDATAHVYGNPMLIKPGI